MYTIKLARGNYRSGKSPMKHLDSAEQMGQLLLNEIEKEIQATIKAEENKD